MLNGLTQKDKPLKVAFLLIGGSQWMGGYNYLLNLLTILKDDKRIEPILFFGNDIEESLLNPLLNLEYKVIYDDLFNIECKQKVVIKATLFGINHRIENIFKDNNIDVVFEAAMYLGWRTTIPRLSWIPDFQHRHLSHMFTKIGYLRRDIVFRLISLNRTIMLSSQNAKQDYINFYGNPKHEIRVVPFAVKKPKIDFNNLDTILKKYNVNKSFFYLPNQFWQHKNHKIVIEAVGKLKQEGQNVLIISSGKCEDERVASHCDVLKSMIKKYNIENNFIMLGSIPYLDVLSLMNLACAVINPSYFEGWSTTVEESKSMGIPLILSSIDIHKEQVNNNAQFFSPTDSDELSRVLAGFSCKKQEKAEKIKDNSDKLIDYGNNFFFSVLAAKNNNNSD